MSAKRESRKMNNKHKPLGSGAISHARRLKRQALFGQPWSSSSSWWQSNEADWQEQPSSSSTWWDSSQQSYQGQDQNRWQSGDDVVDDSRATSSHEARPAHFQAAPVTPPWKKKQSDSEDDAMKVGPADQPDKPPRPWKLLGAPVKTEVKSELSSSSNSDDWGWWKSEKHRKTTCLSQI